MINLTIFKSTINALVFIIMALFLGMLIPFIIAVIAYWVNPIYIPFRECICNAGFIIFSIVGIIISCVYLNHCIDESEKNN